MKLIVDRDQCGGHGRCVAAAPELFDLDDEGMSFALKTDIDPDEESPAREAVADCPQSAIRLV